MFFYEIVYESFDDDANISGALIYMKLSKCYFLECALCYESFIQVLLMTVADQYNCRFAHDKPFSFFFSQAEHNGRKCYIWKSLRPQYY